MKSILDVSNIVYGGYYGSPNWRISGFPLGGVRKIMGILNANLKQSEFALCFDGGSTIKKELLPTYKAGRVPNYSVIAQIDLLKEILLDCDIPFYWDPSLEADDYICSLVKFLSVIKDPDDVNIYSDDRDISCCVSDSVRVRNVTSNGICIDRQNYEERVVSGERIPYNTILVHKMMYGDKSDNYGGLEIPGLRFDTLAQALLLGLQPYLESGQLPDASYMDLEVMEIIIDSLPDSFSDGMKEKIKAQAKIVFPQLVDVTSDGLDVFYQDCASSGDPLYQVEKRHTKFFGFDDFNRQKFDFYCSMLNLNRCHVDRYSTKYADTADAFKAKLSMRSKELASGVMAVERMRSKKTVHTSTSAVQNMALPL